MRAPFITIEGVEGAGKSTQARRLADHLEARGVPFLALREPGGTELGEKLRDLILNDTHIAMEAGTETLLLMASRRELIDRSIRPALEAGRTVLCDRFIDSTLAYQGHGRGLGADWVRRLFDLACHGFYPDVTLWLDLPVDEGRGRLDRPMNDRFEREQRSFHERVREGFLAIAEAEPGRVARIPASGSGDAVFERVLECLRHRFGTIF
jgi:dTMP kinase